MDRDYTIIAEDQGTQQVLRLAESVARTPSTVLISGESGVGKENLARYVHRMSPYASGPFVAVNCASLAASLLESELFGHERGSFSGAAKQHLGVFERADGGTLLLDEVSEISPDLQAKLLRVLQERTIVRVGGNREVPVRIRLIACTNRGLRSSVHAGEFRADLYYRLNVFPLYIPALRDRPSDILPLALFHARQLARQYELPFHGFTSDALTRLQNYHYPGNVRELVNIVERALVLAQGATAIRPEHIFLEPDAVPIPPFPEAPSGITWTQDPPLGVPTPPIERYPALAADHAEPSPSPAQHFASSDILPPVRSPSATSLADARCSTTQAPPTADADASFPCTAVNGVQTEHIASESGSDASPLLITPGAEPLALIEQKIILRTLTAFGGNRTRSADALGVSIRTLRNRIRDYRAMGLEVPNPLSQRDDD